ncbi:hypothetical protein GLYMA_13G112800v4 [Glycine max]|uniref:Uncharacterized protein n=1 Tax=Glycine max TaxID=3847 RepID=A0A0R0GYD6_SOYBN|nr:hypothetical protein GYH30_035851 [Glycine max]KRH19359.1 hypothetical protein GLYMA_13G112800v4 [Glycine max]
MLPRINSIITGKLLACSSRKHPFPCSQDPSNIAIANIESDSTLRLVNPLAQLIFNPIKIAQSSAWDIEQTPRL